MQIWVGCGNGSAIDTFVLVFEYLDVNMSPIYLVVKSRYNSSYTCILVTYIQSCL